MNRGWLAVVLCCAACRPMVSVGADGEVPLEDQCGNNLPTVSCPAQPWGVPVTFARDADLRAQLVGRWAFCGGERRYTGRGALPGLPGGTAIDFWEAGGALQFAYLVGSVALGTPVEAASLVRRTDAPWTGTVRVSTEGGKAHLWLAAADHQEAPWDAQLFDAQPVLQNAAFDVWNFVRVR